LSTGSRLCREGVFYPPGGRTRSKNSSNTSKRQNRRQVRSSTVKYIWSAVNGKNVRNLRSRSVGRDGDNFRARSVRIYSAWSERKRFVIIARRMDDRVRVWFKIFFRVRRFSRGGMVWLVSFLILYGTRFLPIAITERPLLILLLLSSLRPAQ